MDGFPQVCFIKNALQNPNIIVGDYTYYDDPQDSENFERNVLYHYPFIGDKLIIGKFCAIARGAKFIMNGANHKLSGISTYPFQIFGNGWEKSTPSQDEFPYKGDAVVTGDVPAYTVVVGNPAKSIKQRFSPETIELLEPIAWWDWPVEKITRHLTLIVSGDVEALRRCALERP